MMMVSCLMREGRMLSTKSGNITVFGKKNCGLCSAAKDKLRLMELPFEFVDIGPLVEHHEGWRTDGSVEARALSAMFDGHLPILKLDNLPCSYPEAMRLLKAQAAAAQAKSVASAEPMAAPVRLERELAPAFA